MNEEAQLKDLWLGTLSHVRFHARTKGYPNPTIIYSSQQLEGLHGNFRVHLCGENKKLPEIKRILDILHTIKASGGNVKYIKHF